MKKTLLATILSLSLFTPFVGAQSFSSISASQFFSFLPDSAQKTLFSSGELGSSGSTFTTLTYGPTLPFATLLSQDLSIPGATVSQEGIYLFDKPAGDAILKIYNALNALKSMTGTQYYSLSQKKMETLIVSSYRVKSAEDRTPVEDPIFTSVPVEQRVVVFQKDNRLGDGLIELNYQLRPDNLLILTMTNLQSMHYLMIPLVSAGQMKMVFVVVPLADRIAVYARMEVETLKFFGLEHSKDENFRNRLRALAGWLGQRIQNTSLGSR